MSSLLAGISSHVITTPRLALHYLEAGPADGTPVVMLHGNLASARFFEGVMSNGPSDLRFDAADRFREVFFDFLSDA